MSCRCEFRDGRVVTEPAPQRPIFSTPPRSYYQQQADAERIARERRWERDVTRSMTETTELSKAHAKRKSAYSTYSGGGSLWKPEIVPTLENWPVPEDNKAIFSEGDSIDLSQTDTHNRRSDAAKFARAMNKLNSLVGLAPVKDQLQRATDLVKVQTIRAARGMPTLRVSHHMAFVGPPGTGKTTVARLVGELYAALGVLSDGHLVETDRAGLVAEYVGQTAPKTNAVIDSAIGGVLFIDEAYALARPESEDFGCEAIATLATRMENERQDFVVIVAGYPAEIKCFLASNSGFPSRFKQVIDFPPYSDSELLQILRDMASAAGYDLPLATARKAQCILTHEAATSARTFGNARAVRNLLERAVGYQASRVVRMGELNDASLRRLEPEDVPDSLL